MARGRRRRKTGNKVERSGYVYVLTNASMPGMVKVGFTSRSAGVRANELSGATGVPTPFKIVFQARAKDALTLEKAVHRRLRSVRVKQNREFFRCSSRKARKEIVKELKRQQTSTCTKLTLSVSILGLLVLTAWVLLRDLTWLETLQNLYAQGVRTIQSR